MTTLSQPRARSAGRVVRTTSVRRLGHGLARVVSWLRSQAAEIADAGQLGPDPETEIGRSTGARI